MIVKQNDEKIANIPVREREADKEKAPSTVIIITKIERFPSNNNRPINQETMGARKTP
ncbi:hypothetical protein GMMP15_2170005 [Candidatus Magnetomoraceae bacterium gMMP-15]